MRSLRARCTVTLAVTLVLAADPLSASAAVGDNTADRIIGQRDATSSQPNASGFVDASGLSGPGGVVFDASGDLFVADSRNNRVLGYRSPMTTDTIADIVIGQPDVNSNVRNNGGVSATSLSFPNGVAVSPAGNLYVADSGNNRVLEYDRPFATDTAADRVFGQPDFESNTTNNGGLGAASLYAPADVAVGATGDLWVADTFNHRVLMYEDPIATDAVADLALGQLFDRATRLFTNGPNYGGISARSLFAPSGVAVDLGGNVWVADTYNSRVLWYSAPGRSDTTADKVLGQADFASNASNYTGEVSAAGLNEPSAVAVDPNGNVYVSDAFNNRMLMYASPYVLRDRDADRVFGQPDFGSADGSASAQSLFAPAGVAIDPNGNFAVADMDNNRVVLLEAPTPIVTSLVVKTSPATGKRKLVVRGFGMVAGSAVVEVDGTRLATTKYKEPAADGTARRLVATDPNLDEFVPPQVQVRVTIVNPLTGSRSAPILFPEN
jgi:sugar lactone lactonase YvrE